MAKKPTSRTTSPPDVKRPHLAGVADFHSDRVQTIVRLRKEGKSLRQIGKTLGVTGQRVHQLIGKIERRYDVKLRHDSGGFVSVQGAARRLGITLGIATPLARRCGLLTQKRLGRWLIPEAALPVIRAAYESSFLLRCVVCGAALPPRCRSYCPGRCRYVGSRKRWKQRAGILPAIETMSPWHRTLFQLLQKRKAPKREQWLTVTEAVQRAGVTRAQMHFLRIRRYLQCRPHPTRLWRDGSPVHMYAASEIDLVRKAKQKHGR
jgi:hypothetical protein